MNELTTTERKTLAKHEKAIEKNLGAFLAVGQALFAINTGNLYQATHGTFEAYCAERWEFSRQRAYQLISAAEATDALSTIVDTPPTRETHVRPLLAVPVEDQAEVWQRAVDASKDEQGTPQLTAQAVQDAVDRWKASQTPVAQPPIDVESHAVKTAPLPDDEEEVEAWVCDDCGGDQWTVDGKCVGCTSAKDEAPPEEPEQAPPSDDDELINATEEAFRERFAGRLIIAAARLETLAANLRADA